MTVLSISLIFCVDAIYLPALMSLKHSFTPASIGSRGGGFKFAQCVSHGTCVMKNLEDQGYISSFPFLTPDRGTEPRLRITRSYQHLPIHIVINIRLSMSYPP